MKVYLEPRVPNPKREFLADCQLLSSMIRAAIDNDPTLRPFQAKRLVREQTGKVFHFEWEDVRLVVESDEPAERRA